MTKKKVAIALLILITIIGISYISYSVYMKSVLNCEGWIVIENKEMINGKYYFFIENNGYTIRLKCDPEQYGEIIVDPYILYHMRYEYSTYFPTQGQLQLFSTDDSLDTRKSN